MSTPLPILILAGGDTVRTAPPPGLRSGDMLRGYKGALPLPNGKVLVQELIDRLQASGRFREPVLIGPTSIYGPLSLGCRIVDVHGSLERTLIRTVETILEQFDPVSPVAVTACDILPSAAECERLLSEAYEPVRDCVFWGQFVAAPPQGLGASSWKPHYRFAGGDASVRLYPGHLVILRPAALRFRVLARLLHLAYCYRNRPLDYRWSRILLRSLGTLAAQDLRNLLRLQLPGLTVSIPFHCLAAYRRYRGGELSVDGFERAFTRTFVHRRYYHACGNRPVVFSTTHILAFAKDLDTRAELAELFHATN